MNNEILRENNLKTFHLSASTLPTLALSSSLSDFSRRDLSDETYKKQRNKAKETKKNLLPPVLSCYININADEYMIKLSLFPTLKYSWWESQLLLPSVHKMKLLRANSLPFPSLPRLPMHFPPPLGFFFQMSLYHLFSWVGGGRHSKNWLSGKTHQGTPRSAVKTGIITHGFSLLLISPSCQ